MKMKVNVKFNAENKDEGWLGLKGCSLAFDSNKLLTSLMESIMYMVEVADGK